MTCDDKISLAISIVSVILIGVSIYIHFLFGVLANALSVFLNLQLILNSYYKRNNHDG